MKLTEFPKEGCVRIFAASNAAAHRVNSLKLDLDGTRRQVAALTEQKTQFEGLLEILK